MLIRRGPSATNSFTGTVKPGDLYDVTVYIFRSFNDQRITQESMVWETYDEETGQAQFVTPAGDPIDGIQPLATYHFYIAG